ncbi:MAG: rRNA pseudouridine synthase [Verrucomicrobia bacterium]|nr:rRNA pseudouridine synthase [Verrucomicrobiota bacterium]
MKMRLQKYLAAAGAASRRAAETLILEGRVAVNGRSVRVLGSKVDPKTDAVTIDGEPVRPRRKLYVALHKPRGYLCARRDPQKRRLVLDLLPPEWNTLYPAGRLDRDTEGLLFLTNDGEFCHCVTHPSFGILKRYIVTVSGRASEALAVRLIEGVRHRGEQLQAVAAQVVSANNTRSRLEVVLCEGRNREVRRMMKALGVSVERLQRIQIGPIKLGELPSGKWRVLTPAEVQTLFRIARRPSEKLAAKGR